MLDYMDAMCKCAPEDAAQVLNTYMAPTYTWEGSFPFLDHTGTQAVADVFWTPLKQSLTHMQRRQDVFMAGVATDGKTWVMSMGQFMGLFDKEFLGVRRTCKMHHLQYAEYCCIEDGKITHTAMFLDLIGFMNEAGVYPIPPETGHYFVYPGPKDHNGLMLADAPYEKAAESFKVVDDMLNNLFTLNVGKDTPQDMLRQSWHEDMIWYGPCGIGASYTIPRYQMQHQIPFRTNLSEKTANPLYSYFAEGDFVCFYSSMEVKADGGWLGMPAGSKPAHLRGDIDIYYVKDGKISENWCFIDLPYWLHEQGLDIFERTASICNPQI